MHELKTIDPYFSQVWDEQKTFEIRLDDRGFKEGDILWLREYLSDGTYSGDSILCTVTYLLSSKEFKGLAEGYVAMGISILQKKKGE